MTRDGGGHDGRVGRQRGARVATPAVVRAPGVPAGGPAPGRVGDPKAALAHHAGGVRFFVDLANFSQVLEVKNVVGADLDGGERALAVSALGWPREGVTCCW